MHPHEERGHYFSNKLTRTTSWIHPTDMTKKTTKLKRAATSTSLSRADRRQRNMKKNEMMMHQNDDMKIDSPVEDVTLAPGEDESSCE